MTFVLWPPVSPRWVGGKKPNCWRVLLRNELVIETQFIAENVLRERFHFTYLFLLYWSLSQFPPKRLAQQGREIKKVTTVIRGTHPHHWWKHRPRHIPPQRTMLLISCTIFPREQKLPTLTGKVFPGDISLGKRQAHNREKGTHRLFWALQRDTNSGFSRELQMLAGTFFCHVTNMCFTYPEVANFRGPLCPLPESLAGLRDLGGGQICQNNIQNWASGEQ